MSAVSRLLARLGTVRKTSPVSWLALCPAHEDRRPSLVIRSDDDRVLVHCFAGCEIGAVLASVGLSLSDLFERPTTHLAPGLQRPFSPMDALRAVAFEAVVVAVAADQMCNGHVLTAFERARLSVAVERLQRAVEAVQPEHRRRIHRAR